VTFRFGTDVRRNPDWLSPFDRIVIATGARYRFGLGLLAKFLLNTGLARRPPLRNLFARPALRDWFYFDARRGFDEDIRRLPRPGQTVVTIGDARKAGKSKEAIASAFTAALLEQ
jgi:dimethylglycine catabolism A